MESRLRNQHEDAAVNADARDRLYAPVVVLEGHSGAVLSCDFNDDGSVIALGGIDKLVKLWNLPVDADNACLGTITGHKLAVTAVKWSRSPLVLATSSADSTVATWDAERGTRLCKHTGHLGPVNCLDVGGDNKLVSGGDDGSVRVWDEREKKSVAEIASESPILCTTFNARGDTFFVGGIDLEIKAYDARHTAEPIWTVKGHDESITSLASSHDGTALAVRYMDGTLRVINTRETIAQDQTRVTPVSYIGSQSRGEMWLVKACFSGDGSQVYSGTENPDHCAVSWNTVNGLVSSKYSGHSGTVIHVAVHPQLPILTTTSTDGTLIAREI